MDCRPPTIAAEDAVEAVGVSIRTEPITRKQIEWVEVLLKPKLERSDPIPQCKQIPPVWWLFWLMKNGLERIEEDEVNESEIW